MNPPRIAVVAVSCRFAEASTSAELWRNALAGRRSFREIPRSRLDLARYSDGRVDASDSITRVKAGLLSDWRFDPARFRIPAKTFRSADIAHWLALDAADDALGQIGGAARLHRVRTAVIVANTLTGETSRAATLRTRVPMLEDLLRDRLEAEEMAPGAIERIAARFRSALESRFEPPNEETLAGGLANTIAGRIANYFDFQSGAYTVDAACASSLVAVANAGTLLQTGQADAVVVGAVDISLDPFELVGFSRLGALARGDMRVFDARSDGFWPGEGGGFALLMAEDDARRRGLPVLACLRGWGMSSDGNGGLTRPEVEGQYLALSRAYAAAGVDPGDVGYIEAHGTGTAVGDPVEVRALARLRNGSGRALPIGSIKANIGHAKAAAGFAGLVKTILALREGIVPPHVGCSQPHPVFDETGNSIRPAFAPESWPADAARIAGVSGFGFGGINAHIVLEVSESRQRTAALPPPPVEQDAELFLFGGEDAKSVQAQLSVLLRRAPTLTQGEMTDAAFDSFRNLRPGPHRAAVVARTSEELADRLRLATSALAEGTELLDPDGDAFVGCASVGSSVGFLFPGQGSPVRPGGGCWARRFPWVARFRIPPGEDAVDTKHAQPAIAAASLAALEILERCGIAGDAALGHSLGELTALAWSGAIARKDLVPLAAARGAAMAAQAPGKGSMLRLETGKSVAAGLIRGLDLAIACVNGEDEVVVSGEVGEIARAAGRAREKDVATTPLNVSHAFHSPLMAGAEQALIQALSRFRMNALGGTVISSVTGEPLAPSDDLEELLGRQMTAPVRFHDALLALSSRVDFAIELGPGGALSRLARKAGLRALSVDVFGDSLLPLLRAIGFSFARGGRVDLAPIFEGRAVQPIDLEILPELLGNPCARSTEVVEKRPPHDEQAIRSETVSRSGDALAAVVGALASETGLPVERVRPEDRLLDDLHLNSIAVARLSARAAKALGVRIPTRATDLANTTVRGLAETLRELADFSPESVRSGQVAGVEPWVRTYGVQWQEAERAAPVSEPISWTRSDVTIALEAPPDAETGVLLWLPDDAAEPACIDLVARCQEAARLGVRHLAICHSGLPLGGFARSIFLEGPFGSVTLVGRGGSGPESVLDELATEPDGFMEVRLDEAGRRFVPSLRPLDVDLSSAPELDRNDVVLFTGGAKGIGAECAIRLAEKTGCALILVGRSSARSREVAGTIERLHVCGIRHRYVQADVLQAETLGAAVAAASNALGPVTTLVHGAAANEPRRLVDLRMRDVESALQPKTSGLLAAVAAAGRSLRRVVTFGSIIGRVGLEGEAHYALANGWLTALAKRLPPNVQVTNLEWSVWSGAGMAERLGALERLADRGVSAISLDQALDMFEKLVLGGASGDLIVTGRFGAPIGFAGAALGSRAMRFVDKPLLHYAGTELIVETDVSIGRDPYLADHSPGGVPVFPGVMALEAMGQVACALAGCAAPASASGVAFESAVFVPGAESVTLRIAALAADDRAVKVVIRASDDGFANPRFAARFSLAQPVMPPGPVEDVAQGGAVDASPLYGLLYFQAGRFRRLGSIGEVAARRIAASISGTTDNRWFSSFESPALVLGDPATRDAAIHVLQACVPHRRVLPVSVDQIVFHGGCVSAMRAREAHAEGDVFVFDIDMLDRDGKIVEQWRRAAFRAVEELDVDAILAAQPLLAGAYFERVARHRLSVPSIEIALIRDETLTREQRRDRAIGMLAPRSPVVSRSDGRPLTLNGERVSISHSNCMTVAVKAETDVGCDIEMVRRAPTLDWAGLLPGSLLALASTRPGGDPEELCCTRLWTIVEGARKLGIERVDDVRSATGHGTVGGHAVWTFRGNRIRSVTIPFSSGGETGVLGVSVGNEA